MGSKWLGILLLLVYSGLFKSGIHAALDFPYSSPEIIQSYFRLPQIWNSLIGPFGSNQITTLWSYPFGVLLGLLSWLGISHNFLVVLSVIAIMGIGGLGIFKLSQLFGLSKAAQVTTAFFYLANTYIVLLVDGGQILWGLAYSFFPYCIYRVERAIQQKIFLSFWEVFLIVLITLLDLRAWYLLVLIFLGRFIWGLVGFARKKNWWWFYFWLRFGLQSILIFGLLHAYWLVPLYLSKNTALPTELINNLSGDFQTFTSLKHSFLMYQPHWYLNVFGMTSSPKKEFLIIPVLVIIGIWSNRKNPLIFFIIALSLIGVFLAKGPREPAGQIFQLLFSYVPGFVVFRDPTKFFIFIALGYSLLIGSSVDFLQKKLPSRFKLIPVTFIIGWLIFLISPAMFGGTHGLLTANPYYNQNIEFAQKVSQLPEGKILWVPNKIPSGFMDSEHLAVNGTDLINIRPFSTGTRGTYETLNFLREASYSGQLLKIAGIGYLAYPPLDPRLEYKEDQVIYHQLFWEQLKGRIWVKKEEYNAGIPLLKLDDPEKLFFIPQNNYLVIGSDDLYADSTKSAEFSLSKNGLVFLDQKAGMLKEIPQPLHNFLFHYTSNFDFLFALLEKEDFIFPAQLLQHSPDQTGWWKREVGDFLSLKDFLLQKYGVILRDFDLGGGWAIGEGERSITVPLRARKNDKLYIRALQSTRSGELKVTSGEKEIGRVGLNEFSDRFFWYPVGSFDQDGDSVTLHADGDITIINALTVISEAKMQTLTTQSTKYLENKAFNSRLEPNDKENPTVNFTKITDDRYQLKVNGIRKPSVVVFAQSYDSKWELNGSASFPVYSIFNGFMVETDGEYEVRYSPSRYLICGYLVSGGSLLVLIGSVVYRYYEYIHIKAKNK